MRLLIDHDILLYRALWGAKDERYYRQLGVCENMVERILDDLGSTDYTLIMSGSGNFRYAIAPDYKANRSDQPKPRYLYDAKLYFRKYWSAVLSEGCEADDVIGMAHDESTIVVSSDKDFYQLGGLIYNPVKKEMVDIKNPWYFFYMQMLTGDAADNVPGVKNPAKAHHVIPPNFTDKTAKELLAGKSCKECKAIVLEMYEYTHNDRWFAQFDINAKLLFLKRSYADSYNQIF
jgi:5'-3' exonuclease